MISRGQRLGAAIMLPVAVLPVAGIFLRLGQPDLLNLAAVSSAGAAIFHALPLLFAIGVAVGVARDESGVAALAGAIGYLVEMSAVKTFNSQADPGVLAGIIAGLLAGQLYNRFNDIKLPDYLSFFHGKRFVPIVSGVSCLLIGILLGFAWPPIQAAISAAGNWLTLAGPLGGFLFGCLNRLLIVTGLQNILNSLAWFVFGAFQTTQGTVVTGDLHRFFAGDPTAGNFMAGFFPIMMFGLPAACLAMYHEAAPAQRTATKALLISMALTSFLTGVTEPIELTFAFLAPSLYLIHALLTGLSLAVCQMLGVHLGFTFSAGAIDYFMSYKLSRHGWLAVPVGMAFGLTYYVTFRVWIRRFDVATPGRMAQKNRTESDAHLEIERVL